MDRYALGNPQYAAPFPGAARKGGKAGKVAVVTIVVVIVVLIIVGSLVGVIVGMTSGKDPTFPEDTPSRVDPKSKEAMANRALFKVAKSHADAIDESTKNTALASSRVRGFCVAAFKHATVPTKEQLRREIKRQEQEVAHVEDQIRKIRGVYDAAKKRLSRLSVTATDADFREIERNRVEDQTRHEKELERRRGIIEDLNQAIERSPEFYINPIDPKITDEPSTRTLYRYSETAGEPGAGFSRIQFARYPSRVSTAELVATPNYNPDLVPAVRAPKPRRTKGTEIELAAADTKLHDGFILEETFDGIVGKRPKGTNFLDVLADSVYTSLARVGALPVDETFEGRGKSLFPAIDVVSNDAETKISWRSREDNEYNYLLKYIVTRRPVSESIATACKCHVGPLPAGADFEAAYKNANFAKLVRIFLMTSAVTVEQDGSVLYGKSETGTESYSSAKEGVEVAPAWMQLVRRGELKEGETLTVPSDLYVTFPFFIHAPFDEAPSTYLFTTSA